MANKNRLSTHSRVASTLGSSHPARWRDALAAALLLAGIGAAAAQTTPTTAPASRLAAAPAAATANAAGPGSETPARPAIPGTAQVQGTLVPPGAPKASRPASQPTLGCLISPQRVADIGSPVTGVVSAVQVDVGDAVRKGQVLVTLRSDVEHASEQAAHQRWSLEADLRAAESQLALARQRLARATELLGEGFVSPQAVEQARAEMQVAEQRVAQSAGQRDVLARDLGVARAQLDQRTVRAPFDGVIVERWRQPGERVEDRPMLRVAMLDPLRVDLIVPASRFGQYSLNESVPIRPELPSAPVVSATVTHVDRVIDAASNTFRVRLTVANPGHRLPAGARCAVDAPAQAAASPSVGAGTSTAATSTVHAAVTRP